MKTDGFPVNKKDSPIPSCLPLSISASSACIVNKELCRKVGTQSVSCIPAAASWSSFPVRMVPRWKAATLDLMQCEKTPDRWQLLQRSVKPHNMRSMTRAMLQLLVWSACVASPIWRKVAPPCSASMSITVVLPAATGPLPPPP